MGCPLRGRTVSDMTEATQQQQQQVFYVSAESTRVAWMQNYGSEEHCPLGMEIGVGGNQGSNIFKSFMDKLMFEMALKRKEEFRKIEEKTFQAEE